MKTIEKHIAKKVEHVKVIFLLIKEMILIKQITEIIVRFIVDIARITCSVPFKNDFHFRFSTILLFFVIILMRTAAQEALL